MKNIKIPKNGKKLGVIFGFVFAILILNILSADVSVYPIITNKQDYSLENIVEYEILTTAPDRALPGRYCFVVECIVRTYKYGGRLTTSDASPIVNIMLVPPDGRKITLHSNEKGKFCYDFACGVYKVVVPKGVCGEEYSKTITMTYGGLHITHECCDIFGVRVLLPCWLLLMLMLLVILFFLLLRKKKKHANEGTANKTITKRMT